MVDSNSWKQTACIVEPLYKCCCTVVSFICLCISSCNIYASDFHIRLLGYAGTSYKKYKNII